MDEARETVDILDGDPVVDDLHALVGEVDQRAGKAFELGADEAGDQRLAEGQGEAGGVARQLRLLEQEGGDPLRHRARLELLDLFDQRPVGGGGQGEQVEGELRPAQDALRKGLRVEARDPRR